jgi:two-component sensor histidine kinase
VTVLVRLLRWSGWYVLAWAPFAPLMALLIGISNPRMSIRMACVAGAEAMIWAALLGIGVVLLARRVPWTGRLTPRFVGAHTVGAFVYALSWIAGSASDIAERQSAAEWIVSARAVVGWQVLYGVMIYVILAAILYAREGVRASRELRARLDAAEALRTRAELEALRGRLDPHFLFNTLHTVRALTATDAARAQDAIDRLAAMLRATLDAKRSADDIVTLRDELRFVDDYLALEALRLGERLRVRRDVDPGTLDVEVPAFSIQPLVENAIVHAIAPRAGGGVISLRVSAQDARVQVTINDDGPGADPSLVHVARGVGIDAVRRRVQACQNGEGRFEIETAPGRGFTVRLSVPALA